MATTPSNSANATSPGRTLRHTRAAISAVFVIAGAAIGTWTTRIPAIQHRLGLSDGRLSIALLALAVGGLVGMRLAGRLVDRHGARRVITVTSVSLGALLVLTACAPNLLLLVLALTSCGIVHGTCNIGMNAAAVACERAYRRPIMPSFHAGFSIGGVAGAAAGAAGAHFNLGPTTTFAAVATALTLGAVWAVRRISPTVTAASGGQQPARTAHANIPSRLRRRVLVLGLLAFCTLTSEGAAADWSSVYLDRLGASPAYAAAAYAAFAGCMTGGRLTGDRITAVVTPAALLRGCGLLAGGGLAVGILLGNQVAAIFGFACLGAGLSCVIPTLYSTAGNLDPSRPGATLSHVAALGYMGFVTGPVIIGAAAMHLELGHALLILPVLAGVVVVAAPIVSAAPAPARSTERHAARAGDTALAIEPGQRS